MKSLSSPALEVAAEPLIAVTGPRKRLPIAWWATRLQLRLCGMRAIYLTAHSPQPKARIGGIIIGGGDDIEPVLYGALAQQGYRYDRERDHFEMSMIRYALEHDIPILGICRGAQLINVVLRGTLHQDIRPLRQHTPNGRYITPIKWVDLHAGSRMQRQVGAARVKVNSLHSQAIEEVGQGLTVVGRDQDGFVQAVEGTSGFLMGVQWHPEYLPYISTQRKLFAGFSDAVVRGGRSLALPHY